MTNMVICFISISNCSLSYSPSGPFSAGNSSLDYLRGTLGRSYMCREEQTLDVAPDFSLNTFQLQVQPFGITGDNFGAGIVSWIFIYG